MFRNRVGTRVMLFSHAIRVVSLSSTVQLTRISATDDSIAELQAELESGLTLLGASAIFDQLQVLTLVCVSTVPDWLAPSRSQLWPHCANH